MFQYSSKTIFSKWPDSVKLLFLVASSFLAIFFSIPLLQLGLFSFVFLLLLVSGYRSFRKLFLFLVPFLFLTDLSFLFFLSHYLPNIWEIILVSNLRILTLFMSFSFFSYCTDLIAIPRMLRKLHFPKTLSLAVYIALRFLPELERDFSEIRAVQKTRGITPKKPLLFLKSHFVPMVYLLLQRTDELSIAYHLREKRSSQESNKSQ